MLMNKFYSVVCAAMLALASSAAMSADGKLPSKVEINAITTGATISAVDKTNRTFTLTASDGKTHSFTAGPEMRNFDQMNVGDKVEATYVEEMSISVNKSGATPSMQEKTAVVRAPKGAKPGVVLASSTEVTGVVTAIDHKARTVTLMGPKGKEATFPVKEGVKGFASVTKGDNVVVSYTDALSLSVVTAPVAKPKK
jgi:hypothetical protein